MLLSNRYGPLAKHLRLYKVDGYIFIEHIKGVEQHPCWHILSISTTNWTEHVSRDVDYPFDVFNE